MGESPAHNRRCVYCRSREVRQRAAVVDQHGFGFRLVPVDLTPIKMMVRNSDLNTSADLARLSGMHRALRKMIAGGYVQKYRRWYVVVIQSTRSNL